MISGGFPESWQRFPQSGPVFEQARARAVFTLSSSLFDSIQGPMSLRERFAPARPVAADPRAETRAAKALAGKRGRGTIAPPPGAGKAVTALLKPLLKETGMGLNELKRRWVEVAGESFSRSTPEKLAAGVLTLKAPGALAPFLQAQAPLLIERLRIAGAKVKSVRIEQRSGPAAKPASNLRALKKPLTEAEEAALAQALDPVGDPGLKSALMRLGRAVTQG